MTDPSLYGLPPGVDFPRAFAAGLLERHGSAPEELAGVEIWVNTRRMQRRLMTLLAESGARLLPRIRLVAELGTGAFAARLPPPAPPLRRDLELAQLVGGLLEREPSLAPVSARFELARSLGALLDEMHGEGVPPEAVAGLSVAEHSAYFDRTRAFLEIVAPFFASGAAPLPEARQRAAAESIARAWAGAPPSHPVIVAGSTGSRGATRLFMEAVARLPQGAVVLPGFDFDLPEPVWRSLGTALDAEDHPQFRFAALASALGVSPRDVGHWHASEPPNPARARLVSLALRPAPVTDAWLAEGPGLGALEAAAADLTLVEAPGPRQEAEAIALGLRGAAEDGRSAALITPDRTLARRVTAALSRWGIVPDDSAGLPLHLSPPGRFLRQTAQLAARVLAADALLAVLKHPLCASGTERGPHLMMARELELHIRDKGMPYPSRASLDGWVKENAARAAWLDWLFACIDAHSGPGDAPLPEHVARHRLLAETLAAGPGAGPGQSGTLWEAAEGRAALAAFAGLEAEAAAGGTMSGEDYARLLDGVLAAGSVRRPDTGHPRILIWGTLEARVQGAELLILGGLNEGTWPEAPPPDPWLNRAMRDAAGLMLPERRIGLSAHDFQQAVCGGEVWLTRATRDDSAETVPSRWLNRLTNLMGGLGETGGREALEAMRGRGRRWLAWAETLARPVAAEPPALRPSPRLAGRLPERLSVTQVSRLIRDPYAVYAQSILRLRETGALMPEPGAPERGSALHRVLEVAVEQGAAQDPDRLVEVAERVLEEEVPWPTARRFWLARLARVAPWFARTEAERALRGTPAHFELFGRLRHERLPVEFRGKADRIDLDPDGHVLIYDYKTGEPPNAKQQQHFDKQLLVTAAMVERGAFGALGARTVAGASFIGLAKSPKEVPAPFDVAPPDAEWAGLTELLEGYHAGRHGYTARRAPFADAETSPADHLARFGEWEPADEPEPEDIP